MRALFISLILALPALVCAQEKARQVQCRFLGFGAPSDSVLSIDNNGAEILCPLSNTTLSEKINCYATGNKISFLSPKDKTPAATATIPATAKAVLLVFVPSPKKPDTLPWRVLVIEDSKKNFPDGGMFVANFHNQDIRFIIGEHKGMLRPAGMHGYEMPKNRDSFNMAPVVVEFQQGDKWRTASESNLRFLPVMRYMVFAYTDPVSGRPRINTYQDLGVN